MTKRKSREGSKTRPLEKCFGRWRVSAESLFSVLRSRWPSAVERIEEELHNLETELNTDRNKIYRLLSESVVAKTPFGPIRRYRVSTPAGWLRLLFIIDIDNCLIVFTDVQLRDEETYKRIRRKWNH